MVQRGVIKKISIAAVLVMGLALVAAYTDATEDRLLRAAKVLSRVQTRYDGSYKNLSYPGGDPGPRVGVCSDLVVRAYRAIGIDLQVLVHKDMNKNFVLYPASRLYDQTTPDSNIDHRRVPNLKKFFERHAEVLTNSVDEKDLKKWKPADIVIFDLLGNGIPSHIGIISDRKGESGLPMVMHHFPPYPSEDDCLGSWKIVGHYRYLPSSDWNTSPMGR